jgi:hypothetical protein
LVDEPTVESYGCELDLLLNGVVQLRATQSPHISEIKRANDNQRHSYTDSEEKQFAANTQLLSPHLTFCLREE